VRAAFALAVVVLAGCPGEDARNPPKLWLALRGSERVVQLVEVEPDPF
jgi:hypothetical protein